jgi:hypothetical protein
MLADDVTLELVNRLQWEGRDKIAPYFTRYAEETKWRFALGAVEGRPAMLVFDSTGPMVMPAHFVLIDWSASGIVEIRDFLFASYGARGHRLGAVRIESHVTLLRLPSPFGRSGTKLSRWPVPAHLSTFHQGWRADALRRPPGGWFDFIAKVGIGTTRWVFARWV